MKFREIEKILLADGWKFKKAKGSHYHYIHPTKPGKITIPNHTGDIDARTIQSILKQAGLK
ncbi:MAG: type II toxin-antitoxin system HicA family toxin [Firmicutes bacterium]|jgi:predicted RNA binding protein YcfA (HicA-like mRNA interferase family)|nr:type II toxin-antitoxin system HicA family toxin [Bacillota bacterium]